MANQKYAGNRPRENENGGTAQVDACGVVPTRTSDTVMQYHEHYKRLLKLSGAPSNYDEASRLEWTIRWFSSRNGQWAPATIRTYRAALACFAEPYTAGVDSDGGRSARLRTAIASASPEPRSPNEPPRTSARKRIYFSVDERNRLSVHLMEGASKTNRLLAGYVVFGTMIAARPSEWQSAHVFDGALIVSCAKRTNGRGVGDSRAILLDMLTATQRAGLEKFVVEMGKAAGTAESWKRFHWRLAKALRRACIRLGIPPICLYSARQQGLATAKRRMAPEEVAAFAGHASARTARRHYGHRSGGWRIDFGVRPCPEVVALVRTPTSAGRNPTRLRI